MSNLLIWHGGRTIGPYTADETRSYLASGHLDTEARAWTEGFIDWVALPEALSALQGRAAGAPAEFTDVAKRVLVPDGVRGFSWGAMCLTPFWSIGNRVWIGLLSLIPGLGQLVMVWLGFHGRELAWRRQSWPSVAAFQQKQRRWSIAGLSSMTLMILLGVVLLSGRGTGPVAPAPAGREAAPRVAEPPAAARGVSRQAFEARLSGRTPGEVQDLLGRPAYVREQKNVLIYIYRDVTLRPGSQDTDDAAMIGFVAGRAKIFEYMQEKKQ